MRRLNRYVGRTVFYASLGALVVLVSLNSISDLVSLTGSLNESFTVNKLLWVVLLRIPNSTVEFLPYGVFLGCIIGLGIHANNSELTIMRSAGVSFYQLLWAVMRPTLVLIGVGLCLSEFINPNTDRVARELQVGSDNQELLDAPFGYWYRDAQRKEFLHLNRVEAGGRIYGLSRYGFDANGELRYSGFAEQAIYQQHNNTWQLENYRQAILFADRIELAEDPPQTWRTELNPELLNILVLPPESLNVGDLYMFATYRDQQNLNSHEYWLWFWQRILQPLTIVSLVLVGMSFILGSLREVAMGSRLLLAFVVGFFVKVNIEMSGTISSVVSFSSSLGSWFLPLIAVLVPTLVFGLIGLWLLARR